MELGMGEQRGEMVVCIHSVQMSDLGSLDLLRVMALWDKAEMTNLWEGEQGDLRLSGGFVFLDIFLFLLLWIRSMVEKPSACFCSC